MKLRDGSLTALISRSVLVDQAGNIVARGHNMRVQAGDPTAHAEMVAIKWVDRV